MTEPTEGTEHPADDLPEQLRVRREKRQALIDRGIAPYPLNVPYDSAIGEIVAKHDPETLGADAHTGENVAIAGRVIFLRNTGKLCFVRLRAGDGAEVQAMLSLDEIGAESLDDFKAFVDIGDHLAVQGEVVTSRRGELSVRAKSWQIAAKTLRPLPVEHKPLSDEMRVRQRYVDMIVRAEPREMVRAKAAVLRTLRHTLDERDFVEVETPVLQVTNGGAAARPFATHMHAFDQDMLLRIALELDLKRAVAGGVERVYEIGKTFRNEGSDSTHSPEFAMLEAYQAYGDYNDMMDLSKTLIVNSASALGRTVVPARDGTEIDLEGQWRRAPIFELVQEAVEQEVTPRTDLQTLREVADKHEVALQDDWAAGDIVLELYEKLVEHTLIQPTYVCDFPESVRPLAKPHRSEPGLVECFDLVINGVELVNAYSELNDPVIQRARLTEQSLLAAAGDPEAMDLDEEFLRAMEFGMPPMGGLGMGVDRLIMLLMGTSIREAILFPLMRPL
ncbi:lysine--tRNA ligase [Solicola gregarius]|uniref:Lysine--tRNA ligase n=1 Tax=Solicola gregarius TaxID=2908642 RepID=A0AA46TKV1_9ACTN|nr:lysine--tRNA ligase [Solicola gregarius]UYM06978.1 lysine--tRNA ligase [Solicola gregarius]